MEENVKIKEKRHRYFIQTKRFKEFPGLGGKYVITKGIYNLTDNEVSKIQGEVMLFVELNM